MGLLGDLNNTVTMNEIVEDAFGAVLWVKDNIAKEIKVVVSTTLAPLKS